MITFSLLLAYSAKEGSSEKCLFAPKSISVLKYQKRIEPFFSEAQKIDTTPSYQKGSDRSYDMEHSKKDSNTAWYERTLLGASFFSGVSQQLGEGVQAENTAPLSPIDSVQYRHSI